MELHWPFVFFPVVYFVDPAFHRHLPSVDEEKYRPQDKFLDDFKDNVTGLEANYPLLM